MIPMRAAHFLPALPLGLLVLGLLPYAALRRAGRLPPEPRAAALRPSPLLPQLCLEYAYALYQAPLQLCLRLSISADALTASSVLLALLGALAVAQGALGLGGWLLLVGYTCDALDGVVARARGTASDRGEYLDALGDVLGDGLIFVGFLAYYRDDRLGFGLAAAAMVSGTLVTYARAKGQALGVDAPGGVARRFERVSYLGGGTVLAPLLSAWLEPAALHPRYHLLLLVFALLAVTSLWTVAARSRVILGGLAARRG